MSIIETIAIQRNRKDKDNCYSFLAVQKALTEKYFSWVNLVYDDKRILGKGKMQPKGCQTSYEVILSYSPYLGIKRYERVFITTPEISFNTEIHLNGDKSLCLYHPGDFLIPPPLHKILAWTSEWFVKYEFYKKYGVWIGEEYEH